MRQPAPDKSRCQIQVIVLKHDQRRMLTRSLSHYCLSKCFIGRNIPSLADQCLPLDDFKGAYQATQYLIEQGHQRIAHITGILSHQDALERRAGYEQALVDAGLELDPDLIIEGDFLEQSGMLAIEMLFTRGRPFSAIFAANDQMACGVLLALYRRGIRVPDDMSIIGFDDLEFAAFLNPPLTTVEQPKREFGEKIFQTLLGLMQGEANQSIVIFPKLIIRGTTKKI